MNNKIKNKKILVTGGSGFLGSHLIDRLLKEKAKVYCIDDFSTGRKEKTSHHLNNKNFHLTAETILNEKVMKSLVQECDLIFHFAAVVGVHLYVTQPRKVLEVNIEGTKIILDIAAKYNKKVLFSSTSEVYGRNPKVPWAEDDDRVLGSTTIDRWVYSTTKAVNEHLCLAYHKSYGLPVVIFRFFNAYGPRIDEPGSGRVIAILGAQAIENKPLTIIGDGKQTRCFTYIDDVIDGVIAAANSDVAIGQIFNIGNDKETTILELAKTIKRVFKSKSKIVFVDQKEIYGESYEDIPRRVPCTEKARRMLGFNPTTSLEKGLKKTFPWFKKNYYSSKQK